LDYPEDHDAPLEWRAPSERSSTFPSAFSFAAERKSFGRNNAISGRIAGDECERHWNAALPAFDLGQWNLNRRR